MPEPKKIAVVLAGAVAKGGFEAGALAELVRRNVQIGQIVAASSGALNGAILAAAIHGASDPADLATRLDGLCDLWIAHDDVWDAFHFDWKDFLVGKGLSDQTKLTRLLSDHIKPSPRGAAGQDITLRIVVSPLQGVLLKDGSSSFEEVRIFKNADFETEAGLTRLFEVAVASASFPGAFVPSHVEGLGPCVDGGTVNNTPIGYALQDDPSIEGVLVIAPTPPNAIYTPEKAEGLGGFALIGRLADMLINERLHRDLKEARETNQALRAIEQSQKLSPLADDIRQALGWETRRYVELSCIRPAAELDGNAFSGFRDAKLRKAYVEAGRTSAKEQLAPTGAPRV